jgi:hypothetical protein
MSLKYCSDLTYLRRIGKEIGKNTEGVVVNLDLNKFRAIVENKETVVVQLIIRAYYAF